MRFDKAFIFGKVSRRIFALFVLSAFVPMLVMAVLTYSRVSNLIAEQARSKLVGASKDFALSVNQRLILAQEVLYRSTLRLRTSGYRPSEQVLESMKDMYSSLSIAGPNTKSLAIFGNAIAWPSIGKTQIAHLLKHKSVLIVQLDSGSSPRIRLLHIINPASSRNFGLIAELKTNYLWGGDENFPYMTGLCIFSESGIMLFCSKPDLAKASAILVSKLAKPDFSSQVLIGKVPSIMGQWQLYLKPEFDSLSWTAQAVQPLAFAMRPAEDFSRIFLYVIVLTLLLVTLLSVIQIRRTMVPLEKLILGTRRLAKEDFDYRVDVVRNDEFGELATLFNDMSARLGSQLGALKALSSIDQIILTKQDIDPVFEIALTLIRTIISTGFLGIAVLDNHASEARLYSPRSAQAGGIEMNRISVVTEAVPELASQAEGCWLDGTNNLKHYMLLPGLQLSGKIFILPILAEGSVNAFICIEVNSRNDLPQHALIQLRDLGDRIGVALSATARTEQLIHQARHDDLTGLPNRLLFRERLASEIALAQRENKMLALLFIDLDHFKNINDTLGHSAGDLLLKQAAQRLSSSRGSDTVARLGGDEFAIILPGISRIQSVTTVAENIVNKFSESFMIAGNECFITASIGIAISPTDGQNAEVLLRNADTAMYRAKSIGRSRFVYFKEQMNIVANEQMNLEREIRQGLSRNEFVLYYQPKMDLGTGKFAGAEALVRWVHPTRGLIPPSVFIPVAEDTGLIEEMGRQVIQNTCAQYAAWDNAGVLIPHIAVNVSIRQFRRGDLMKVIKEALNSSSMPPGALEIEVTESLFMDKNNEGISTLENLRLMGIRVAIDDFGTGYSSLSKLRYLPADILKIDKSFVDDMINDESARAIAKMLLELAHTLNKTVVAEGVETLEQLNLLREWECDIIQGYCYSKPLTPDKFIEFVSEKIR
ncbi:MAG TPA: EAL domain-containing protein [Gallionella sp.]|nr:EAL domain-containing protein [Gallionella sp.]